MDLTKTSLMRVLSIVLFSVVIASAAVAWSQDKTTSANQSTNVSSKPNQPVPLPIDLVAFFSGEWTGTGKFSSGKEISADAKFSSELDNQWLLYSHQDRVPNKYKSLGMWGFERASGKFVMIIEDNFGGTRRFESDNGWTNGKIVFATSVANGSNSPLERFTFERQSNQSFKMSYEISKDGNDWKLGDYLIFTRK